MKLGSVKVFCNVCRKAYLTSFNEFAGRVCSKDCWDRLIEFRKEVNAGKNLENN